MVTWPVRVPMMMMMMMIPEYRTHAVSRFFFVLIFMCVWMGGWMFCITLHSLSMDGRKKNRWIWFKWIRIQSIFFFFLLIFYLLNLRFFLFHRRCCCRCCCCCSPNSIDLFLLLLFMCNNKKKMWKLSSKKTLSKYR